MATFRKRGTSWTAQVKLPGGKTRSKSFPTKPMAAAWARDVEAMRDRGVVRDPALDRLTVGQMWPTFTRIRRGLLAPATVTKNGSHWKTHLEPAFGDVAVVAMRRSTVEAWVAEQVEAGVGVPTLEACVRLLSALMEAAVDDGVVTANPLRRVRVPRHQPRRRRFVTSAELAMVIEKIEAPDHRLLIEVMAATGLRIGEALGLTAADIGPGAATVSVREVWTRHGFKEYPKSDRAVRTVPVPEELRSLLRAHVRTMLPTARVFHGDDRNLNRRVLVPACEAAGVDAFTMHELRHHAASVWVAGGVPLFEVARALGHADTRTIEATYSHLVPGAHDRLLDARRRMG